MHTIGWAIKQMDDGASVMRPGWNGKGMYLFLIHKWDAHPALPATPQPFVAMKTADNKVVPWLASQTDLLATDWELYSF